MSTSRIDDFFKRHTNTLKAAGIFAALAGGCTLVANDSFRNNILNFFSTNDNRQWHSHNYFYPPNKTPSPSPEEADKAREREARREASDAELKLAAEVAEEKLRKLEHRERIRGRIDKPQPDLQTISVAPN